MSTTQTNSITPVQMSLWAWETPNTKNREENTLIMMGSSGFEGLRGSTQDYIKYKEYCRSWCACELSDGGGEITDNGWMGLTRNARHKPKMWGVKLKYQVIITVRCRDRGLKWRNKWVVKEVETKREGWRAMIILVCNLFIGSCVGESCGWIVCSSVS